jgi:hypothetical protein
LSTLTKSDQAESFLATKLRQNWKDIESGQLELSELVHPLNQNDRVPEIETGPKALERGPEAMAQEIRVSAESQASWNSLVKSFEQMNPQGKREVSLIDLMDSLTPLNWDTTE